MAKRESAYDLRLDMRSYLISLHSESIEFVKSYVYKPVDHEGDNVVYLRNRIDLITGIHDGLAGVYSMQKYKIKEQKTLRSNARNYIKKYYANGKLKEIECYADGRFDCRFVAEYSGNKRYLLPFTEDGIGYPTETHVLEFHDDFYEEYMVDEALIAYRRYTPVANDKYAYLHIIYIPEGDYPINAMETGTFVIAEQISYFTESHYSGCEEFDANRKQLPFSVTDMPLIEKIAT